MSFQFIARRKKSLSYLSKLSTHDKNIHGYNSPRLFSVLSSSQPTPSCRNNYAIPTDVGFIRRTNNSIHQQHQPWKMVPANNFATTSQKEEEEPKKKDNDNTNNDNDNDDSSSSSKDSLRDTINRIKKEKGEDPVNDGGMNFGELFGGLNNNETLKQFKSQVSETWNELLQAGEAKSINKKITTNMRPEATKEGEAEYTGPVDIMIIDPTENLTAWERMQRRLTEAPIIQDLLNRSEAVYEKSGAKKAKEKVDHVVEDAKEVWETSQNPWIYRMSSVYDTLTADTPESYAVQQLRVLDPGFTLEDFQKDVVEHTLPQIMEWFLEGKINQLKPWLGDGVFKRIAAEITARKKEGVEIDTNVLAIMNSEILACEIDEVSKGNSPIIVMHFMCQQINCVRKTKTGEIVEGHDQDVRANSYVTAFQREYDEEKGELNWKIVDFRFNGAIAYI